MRKGRRGVMTPPPSSLILHSSLVILHLIPMSSLDADKLKVFAGRSNPQLAQTICDYLQIPLGRGKGDLFPDGELIVKVDEDVRGRDCYVVQPTSHPINAHLMELLIWIDTLKRASASRVTAGIPYF